MNLESAGSLAVARYLRLASWYAVVVSVIVCIRLRRVGHTPLLLIGEELDQDQAHQATGENYVAQLHGV